MRLNFYRTSPMQRSTCGLHGCQIDNGNHRWYGLDVHLLLKIGLRLPGSTIYHCHSLYLAIPPCAHVRNAGWQGPGDDIMVFMLWRNGYAAAVNWREMSPSQHLYHGLLRRSVGDARQPENQIVYASTW